MHYEVVGFFWICCLLVCVREIQPKSVCFARIGILGSHKYTKTNKHGSNFRLLFLAQGLIDSGIPIHVHCVLKL